MATHPSIAEQLLTNYEAILTLNVMNMQKLVMERHWKLWKGIESYRVIRGHGSG